VCGAARFQFSSHLLHPSFFVVGASPEYTSAAQATRLPAPPRLLRPSTGKSTLSGQDFEALPGAVRARARGHTR
jgi:hypothetical protein